MRSGTMTIMAVAVLLVLAGWSASALAEELVKAPAGETKTDDATLLDKLTALTKGEKLTIEGTAFVRYWIKLQDKEAGGSEEYKNSFELWRFYIGLKSKLASWLTARVTADVGPEKGDGGDSRYGLFLKYGWFDAEFVKGLHLRAGIIDHPYHSKTDKFWGYRYVFMNIGDEEKLWHSADLGLYLKYVIPKKIGEVAIGFVNGSGYKKALDEDGSKDIWGHLWLTPFAPLGKVGERFVLGGHLSYPLTPNDQIDKALLYSLFAGYSDDWFTLGYQFVSNYLVGANIDWMADESGVADAGHAIYFRFDTPFGLGVLGRFVNLDEDKNVETERHKYQVLQGLSYAPIPLFQVALSCSVSWWPDDDTLEEEIKLFLSTEFKF